MPAVAAEGPAMNTKSAIDSLAFVVLDLEATDSAERPTQ